MPTFPPTLFRAFIGMGSNLANSTGDSVAILREAAQGLQELSHHPIQLSSLYTSSPLGPQDQPDYYNAAALITTPLSPHALLDQLHQLEQLAGRVRVRRWGERTLDLDILLIDQGIEHPTYIQDERLSIPHIGILERSFVVQPLLELDADLIVGGTLLATSVMATCHEGIRTIHGADWAQRASA